MEIRDAARKHGISEPDIEHAIEFVIRYVSFEQYGEERVLYIGPARDGQLLELILVPSPDPDRVIHADYLRAKFYPYLRSR